MNLDTGNHDPSAPRTRCLDSEELGEFLGLSVRSIDRLRQSGALTYLRLGNQTIRFAPEDIAEFVAKSRVVEGAGR
jgi:predicted DNA-binding transcriptional regulator AlpA